MSTIEELAASLPPIEKVAVPYDTYIFLVRQAIHDGYCHLCAGCNEPIWEESEHHCGEISQHIYPTSYAVTDITQKERPLYEHA